MVQVVTSGVPIPCGRWLVLMLEQLGLKIAQFASRVVSSADRPSLLVEQIQITVARQIQVNLDTWTCMR